MRVLVVKLSSFGDVIHTFPALTDLAAAFPGIEVDWLVEEAFRGIARLHPAVSEAIPVRFRRFRWPPARWPELAGELRGLRRTLRSRHYDHVVDLQGLWKSAVFSRFAGVPVSGYDPASAREPAATRLYRFRFPVSRQQLAVERSRQLLALALGYPVPVQPGRFGIAVPPKPQIPGLPDRYALVIHATSWPTKHWPEANWHALIAELGKAGKAVVLPWGSPAEKAAAERLAAASPLAFVLPSLLFGDDLAGVFGHADFAVGLDSGPMHLAAALGIRGVWLYGPTDPGLTGPYGDGQTVLRSSYREAPCRRRTCDREPGGLCCMAAIGLAEVSAAVARLAG